MLRLFSKKPRQIWAVYESWERGKGPILCCYYKELEALEEYKRLHKKYPGKRYGIEMTQVK